MNPEWVVKRGRTETVLHNGPMNAFFFLNESGGPLGNYLLNQTEARVGQSHFCREITDQSIHREHYLAAMSPHQKFPCKVEKVFYCTQRLWKLESKMFDASPDI